MPSKAWWGLLNSPVGGVDQDQNARRNGADPSQGSSGGSSATRCPPARCSGRDVPPEPHARPLLQTTRLVIRSPGYTREDCASVVQVGVAWFPRCRVTLPVSPSGDGPHACSPPNCAGLDRTRGCRRCFRGKYKKGQASEHRRRGRKKKRLRVLGRWLISGSPGLSCLAKGGPLRGSSCLSGLGPVCRGRNRRGLFVRCLA